MKWLDFLLGGPKPEEWKFIGHMPVELVRTVSPQKKTRFHIDIKFYMTETGKRRVAINDRGQAGAEDWITKYSDEYAQADLWLNGGAFPKNFVPVGEVLKDMLIRLIDKELVGDDK